MLVIAKRVDLNNTRFKQFGREFKLLMVSQSFRSSLVNQDDGLRTLAFVFLYHWEGL